MNFRWPLKKHNEGASLAAVVITIMFVMTMGLIVLTVTATNIRMREVEESGKRNFYGADGVMEEIASGLNDKASVALEAAYTEMLSDYRNYMMSGVDIQKKFGYLYIDNLKNMFFDPSIAPVVNSSGLDMIYVYGHYREDDIKAVMSAANRPYFQPIAETTFSADYEDGIFTLHNLRVVYTDSRGYETIISTDMVFHTPELNLGDNDSLKEFMKYALIADRQIQVRGSNSSVDGSMYAGYNGITVLGGASNVTLAGNNIVTRGDININSGSLNVTVGDDRGSVWAENVTTTAFVDPVTHSASPSSLLMKGNLYISDDLTLNAADSRVTLEGNYYGYNFLKTYDGNNTTGSQYSSAIVINGKKANLNMENLNYLMLAGRTYIARGTNDNVNDVVLGESLSIRTNQLAYYVPDRFLDDVAGVKTFTTDKAEEYARYIKVTNVMDYLNPTEPVLAYRFRDSTATGPTARYLYRYYLNFKSEQDANDFFVAFSAANETRINNLGDEYADAIIIGDGVIITFKGDVMTRESASDDFKVKDTTIIGSAWAPDTGAYYIYARQMARDYKSLQLYLEPWSMHSSETEVDASHVRFNDKKDDPVTNYFIRFSDIASGSVTEEPDGHRLIAVVGNNPSSSSDIYTINATYTEGIVIATGNVRVNNNFKGMIIAGGDIELFSNNVTVESDEMLVSEMFKEDAERSVPIFSHLFPGYGHSIENTIGLVNIDKYQTYENWTRTEN